jgi:hypothetical protein
MNMRKSMKRSSLFAAALLASATLGAGSAFAGETRTYVVSWFHISPAVGSDKADCPQGFNPNAEENFKYWLKQMGKTPAEIEKAMDDFPNSVYADATNRGRIDGKPVNVYANPTSIPDPNIKTIKSDKALGFNLDGNEKTGGFIDVDTGEKGIDNQMFRALGCIVSERGQRHGGFESRPGYPAIQWDHNRVFTPAWLIEVSDIDDLQNDPDIGIAIVQATRPVVKDANGEPQRDMTFEVDNNPRTKNITRGAIKNGVLQSTKDVDNFYMVLAKYGIIPFIGLEKAKYRFTFAEDGSLKGIVGGYQDWLDLYGGFGRGGAGVEVNISLDMPGIYYALRKMADAVPDPKTGQNTRISAAYWIDAVPAFIAKPQNTAQAEK